MNNKITQKEKYVAEILESLSYILTDRDNDIYSSLRWIKEKTEEYIDNRKGGE